MEKILLDMGKAIMYGFLVFVGMFIGLFLFRPLICDFINDLTCIKEPKNNIHFKYIDVDKEIYDDEFEDMDEETRRTEPVVS